MRICLNLSCCQVFDSATQHVFHLVLFAVRFGSKAHRAVMQLLQKLLMMMSQGPTAAAPAVLLTAVVMKAVTKAMLI